jgi:hypothetical protein
MLKLKPHLSVQQIAKKHRLDVSFIQKQLDMGEPIEHEHTKDHTLAMDIALQHLDEIPDYYTRLKKMEADAKKEHKQFKDVKVSEGNLHQWFKGSKSKDGKSGWVNVVTGGTCASDEPGEGTPKCVSSTKRTSMTKAERLSASKRKKAADPGQQQKTGAAKPTYVSTNSPEKKMNEEADKKNKSSGKKDACYTKVKSRYDVWPSAYASGALVKCRKVGAANWGNKSESMNDNALDYDWNGPIREKAQRYCPKCEKLETRDECRYGVKYWDMFSLPAEVVSSKKDYNITMPYPANKAAVALPKLKEHKGIVAEILKDIQEEDPCWKGYTQVGMKDKGGKKVPNCVPSKGKEYKEEVEIEEAVRLPATNGNIISVILSWRGRSYMTKMFFPQVKMPSRREVTDQIQKVYPGSTILQYNLAGLEPGQPLIQVSDKSKNYLLNNKTIGEETEVSEVVYESGDYWHPDPKKDSAISGVGNKMRSREDRGQDTSAQTKPDYSNRLKPGETYMQFSKRKQAERTQKEEVAAWQRKEGKNQKGGLNEKGRKSYERENPGSDLKAPQPEGGSRRDSFCARMKGMKKKLTSAKTANDPDSRINKSLRAWNC